MNTNAPTNIKNLFILIVILVLMANIHTNANINTNIDMNIRNSVPPDINAHILIKYSQYLYH